MWYDNSPINIQYIYLYNYKCILLFSWELSSRVAGSRDSTEGDNAIVGISHIEGFPSRNGNN